MDVKVNIAVVTDSSDTNYGFEAVLSEPALNAVLFDFNPSGHKTVVRIKALHAALIDEMRAIQASEGASQAQKRCAAIAITELEGTQMRAVKALFAK